MLLVSVAHAVVLAPVNPIMDAHSVDASRRKPGFEYGWVRAAVMLVSGQCIDWAGLGVIGWLNAGLLAA